MKTKKKSPLMKQERTPSIVNVIDKAVAEMCPSSESKRLLTTLAYKKLYGEDSEV